jgi:5-methylcytosine-specific restriction endonuclease McrA
MNCIVDGCCNKALRRGYCDKHYRQILECGEVYKTDYEAYCEKRSALVQSVLKDLRDGMPRDEVRNRYNINRSQLKDIIKTYGDDSLKIDQALTDDQISDKLIENGTLLRYAGEYKRGQYILLHCDVCGSTMRYSSHALFRKHIGCKECKRREQEQRKQQSEKENAERAAAIEQARAEAAKQRAMQHEARRREIVCPVCGETFITYKARQITCSPECGRKRANIRHTRRNDTRISKDKRIDKISLDVLFRRDSGVCHICGKQCNWNDYTVTETTIIAGNWYPSVDHIVPVSLGGADAWDNVMLAHRICNSIRGNNVE